MTIINVIEAMVIAFMLYYYFNNYYLGCCYYYLFTIVFIILIIEYINVQMRQFVESIVCKSSKPNLLYVLHPCNILNVHSKVVLFFL